MDRWLKWQREQMLRRPVVSAVVIGLVWGLVLGTVDVVLGSGSHAVFSYVFATVFGVVVAALTKTRTYEWSHSASEIAKALIDHGLRIDQLGEHPWTRWQRFPWLRRLEDGRWAVPEGRPHVPLSLSVLASAPVVRPLV